MRGLELEAMRPEGYVCGKWMERFLDPNAIVEEVQVKFLGVERVEEAIGYLRVRGFDRGESMVILQRAFGISYGEAKPLVHHSRAWAEERDAAEQLHKEMEKELDSG